jgi:hypothetical protein
MIQENELIIEAITKIANSDNMRKLHKKNVMYDRTINENETARVLHSYILFSDELEKDGETK